MRQWRGRPHTHDGWIDKLLQVCLGRNLQWQIGSATDSRSDIESHDCACVRSHVTLTVKVSARVTTWEGGWSIVVEDQLLSREAFEIDDHVPAIGGCGDQAATEGHWIERHPGRDKH